MKINLNNKNKGITLVALVITIIILLILAGITINSLTENELFEKTKLAKERTENAEKTENTRLEEYGDAINSYIDASNRNTLGENGILLWEGSATSGEITLKDNYKFSQFNTIRFMYTDDEGRSMVEKDIHEQSIEYTKEKENSYITLTGYSTNVINIWKFAENKFEFQQPTTGYVLNRIYGINY